MKGVSLRIVDEKGQDVRKTKKIQRVLADVETDLDAARELVVEALVKLVPLVGSEVAERKIGEWLQKQAQKLLEGREVADKEPS